jgi:methylmalonyl-CoA mutase cobalamin-binding subunit
MRSFLLVGLVPALLWCAPATARPTVAIIDSGVAPVEELKTVLRAEYDVAASPPRPAFAPRYDHGTMVATILNRAAGGAIDIISIRIDDPAGCPADQHPPCQPSGRPVAAAIDKAADLGVDAINLSLSMANDRTITAAVERAAARGILVIMAAGNHGRAYPDNRSMARAGFPNTILVGALDPAGQPWSGSDRPEADDPRVHYVWQPGVAISTRIASGAAVHATGTSFAAPVETARRVLAKHDPVRTLVATSAPAPAATAQTVSAGTTASGTTAPAACPGEPCPL